MAAPEHSQFVTPDPGLDALIALQQRLAAELIVELAEAGIEASMLDLLDALACAGLRLIHDRAGVSSAAYLARIAEIAGIEDAA